LRTTLFLKTASEVRDEVEDYLNDSGNTLATAAQYLSRVQMAVSAWGRRVVVPHYYAFDMGSGTYEYALPSYIRRPFRVLVRQPIRDFPIAADDADDESNYYWDEWNAYDVHSDGAGGYTLHLHSYPGADSARIEWFAENGGFPTTPTVSTTITSASTSLIVASSDYHLTNSAGYFKCEDEWSAYAGQTTKTSSVFTATNLIRGVYGTTAASHTSTTAISWGIGVDDQRLWQQLYDKVASMVHLLNMNKSTGEDSNRHEKLFVAYRDMADNFWRKEGYTTQSSPRFVPKRRSMGIFPWQ
jgi:hypothetical protein